MMLHYDHDKPYEIDQVENEVVNQGYGPKI